MNLLVSRIVKTPDFPGYTVIRELKGGGMTDLFVAHNSDQERVVIRRPNEKYIRDKKILKSFYNSVDILRRVSHPNIVRLIEAGYVDNLPFMVLHYVECETLRNLLVQRSSFISENALSFIRQIAAALFTIHHEGFLHLDLKPENLLVQDNGHIVLIDLDLAIPKSARPTKLKQVPGTPSYMAPETLTKRLVEERTDIYSFGVTCYEIVTFRKPYEGDTADAILKAQLDPKVEPTPMSQYNPDVPAKLEAVILKCLAKAPDNRYPSMSLIVKDLEAIV